MTQDINRRNLLQLFGITALAGGALQFDLGHSTKIVTDPTGGYIASHTKNARWFWAPIKGQRTRVFFADLGDMLPAWDANLDQSYPAYTTHFWCEHFDCYSQVDKDVVDLSSDALQFRTAEDMAVLEAHGLDGSIEFPDEAAA
jgi:hypothetical protein